MGKWGNGGVLVPTAAVRPGGSVGTEPSTVLVSPHSVPPLAPGTVWSSVRGVWGLQARVVAVPGWLLAPRYTVRGCFLAGPPQLCPLSPAPWSCCQPALQGTAGLGGVWGPWAEGGLC